MSQQRFSLSQQSYDDDLMLTPKENLPPFTPPSSQESIPSQSSQEKSKDVFINGSPPDNLATFGPASQGSGQQIKTEHYSNENNVCDSQDPFGNDSKDTGFSESSSPKLNDQDYNYELINSQETRETYIKSLYENESKEISSTQSTCASSFSQESSQLAEFKNQVFLDDNQTPPFSDSQSETQTPPSTLLSMTKIKSRNHLSKRKQDINFSHWHDKFFNGEDGTPNQTYNPDNDNDDYEGDLVIDENPGVRNTKKVKLTSESFMDKSKLDKRERNRLSAKKVRDTRRKKYKDAEDEVAEFTREIKKKKLKLVKLENQAEYINNFYQKMKLELEMKSKQKDSQ